jgi:hypothetical protein
VPSFISFISDEFFNQQNEGGYSMKTIFIFFLNLIISLAISSGSFAQDFSIGGSQAVESFGQVLIPEIGGTTITHSVDPDSIFDDGSLSCRQPVTNYTVENHYWRSFVLSDFGITNDFNVTLVEIGIQQALTGNGGVQPITCNLYITDGTLFPGGYPNSLILIGTTTLDVPDQAVTHFPILVTGTAPAGSELVVEISIPEGVVEENIFFIGINDFGETAPSYIMASGCGFPIPTPNVVPPGFIEQQYVMSVTGDETVPVELTSFTVDVNNQGNVILNWSTATEINNQLFEIERRIPEGQFNTIGFVEGYGTTTQQQDYSYKDNAVGTGTFFYRLKQIDFGGQFEYSDEIEVEVNGPLTFALEQNYPNPFNPSTIIKYSVPETGSVKLDVYNLVGEEVAVLVNEIKEAGFYQVTFEASNLPSGAYFYKLQAGNSVQLNKMVFLK